MSQCEFFDAFGDSTVHLMSRRGTPEELTLEDIYQQFKARMLDEMRQAEAEVQRRHMDIRMKVPRRKPT